MPKFHPSFVPSAQEASKIKAVVEEREKKIKAVEEEASQLQDKMANLDMKKEQLHTQLEDHRAFIAPIRRLHFELLQEIFRHCLPVTHNAVLCSRQAPLLLGHVCSSWRRLSAESPELWNTINIVIPPQNLVAIHQKTPPLEEITAWLSRSGVLPLFISISSSYPPVTPGGTLDLYHSRYIDAIAAFQSRWKSIRINIPTYSWPNYFFARFNASDVPLLEQIHIQGPRALDSPPLMGNEATFDLKSVTREDSIMHAPRLRSISVLPFGSELLQLSLNWENITELNLSWNVFHYHEITRVLLLCPNLESCVISSVDPRAFDPIEGITVISLPKLRSLSLIDESDTESDLSHLLKGLHAPNLRHLAYERRPHWPPPGEDGHQLEDTINALAIFLKRLIHPLEEFELATDSILCGDVMKMLSLVPGVRRLSLRGVGKAMDSPPPSYYPHPHIPHIPTFLFKDRQLRKLTPGRGRYSLKSVTRGLIVLSVDSNSDSNDSDDEGHHPTAPSSNQQHITSTDTNQQPTTLCPNLEIIHFSGSMFSDSAMLKFLKSRTVDHEKNNVAKIKKASIAFVSGKEQEGGTEEEIERLERETLVRVSVMRYKQKPRSRSKRWDYSPYDGLDPILGWGWSDYRYRQPNYFGFE
jgi:hypothetical protein